MIEFFKKIYNQIMQFDNYTNEYLEVTNSLELPSLAYTNWGMHFADLKDYDNAIDKLETAMLMHGQNPKPCISLGIIYAKLKEYKKSSEYLLEALRRDSQNAYAYSVLSSVYIAVDKFEEAEEALKKALKLSPSDAEIYLNYGIFYAKAQKKLKAIEMLKKSKFYNPDNAHSAFLLGVMYFETNQTEKAFKEFKYIETINPKYKKLNYYLALCYQRSKAYSQAVEYGQRALIEESDNPSIYVLLAHSFVNLGEKEAAIKIYELGEKEKINDFEFFLSAGVIYSKYEDMEKAKKFLEKALAIKPANSTALYKMGACLKKENKLQEAEEYFQKALETDNNNSFALTELGMLKYDKQDWENAIDLFFKAINISNEKNYLYFYIANSYYRLGRLKKSVEYYEKTIEYYPNNIEAFINCTICLMDMNNDKEALRKIRSAYQISKKSEKVILMYALANLKCGIYTDAAEKTDMLLAENPENKGAKLIKAHTLISLNKPQIALNLLDSLPEETKKTEIFIFLSFLAYKALVEENPSHYNESMLNLYLDKMDSIDSEALKKGGIFSYITK